MRLFLTLKCFWAFLVTSLMNTRNPPASWRWALSEDFDTVIRRLKTRAYHNLDSEASTRVVVELALLNGRNTLKAMYVLSFMFDAEGTTSRSAGLFRNIPRYSGWVRHCWLSLTKLSWTGASCPEDMVLVVVVMMETCCARKARLQSNSNENTYSFRPRQQG